jgi:hypothetical protein
MGVGLFGFIFKTLRVRTNDPNNSKYWLPAKLDEIDNPSGPGKLLPLHGTNWDLGDVTGPSADYVTAITTSQWWTVTTVTNPEPFKDETPISCPDKPLPHLKLPTMTILGLDNVWVEDNPEIDTNGTGYVATIAVRFGYYDQKSFPQLGPVTLDGTWTLTQCVCSALKSAPTVCDGKLSETINGEGPVTAVLTDVYAEALVDIRVAGVGAERAVVVTVQHINLRGLPPAPAPTIAITKLNFTTSQSPLVKKEWIKAARRALTNPDATKAMIANVNAALNEPNNLAKLSDTLNRKFAGIIDDTLGTIPAGKLPSGQGAPNPVDLYLFDRTRYALNNPASQFYVPRVILGVADPKLEPDNIDSIDLGAQSIDDFDFTSIRLTQVVLTGLSNAVTPVGQLTFREEQGDVDATIALGTLSPPPVVAVGGRNIQVPPPPLQITGNFTLMIDGVDQPTTGSAVITVAPAQIAVTMHLDGPDAATLTVTFRSVSLAANPDAIKVKLSLVSDFSDIINEVINQPSIKQKVLDGINQRASGHLDRLSSAATDKVRQVIAEKLDG